MFSARLNDYCLFVLIIYVPVNIVSVMSERFPYRKDVQNYVNLRKEFTVIIRKTQSK